MDPKDRSGSCSDSELITLSEADWDSLKSKVNKFLKTKKFGLGYPLTIPMIRTAMKNLKKDITLNESNKFNLLLYAKFLTHYGSIYGQGYALIGPILRRSKIKETCLEQKRVENCYEEFLDESKIKYYWFIAEEPEGGAYYFDFTERGKGRIYYISYNGRSRFFTENFLTFLDLLYEDYAYHK